MKVLLLGSGGREHTLAWKIAQSKYCSKLYIAPGNAGTSLCGINITLSDSDVDEIKAFIIKENIDMLVVGPEQALVNGIYDAIHSDEACKHVIVIGPSKQGALLEL
jgi:phosphoribosylamine--glycine ligase